MTAVKAALFGFGSIGREVAAGWPTLPSSITLSAVCVRPHQIDAARALLGEHVAIVTEVEEMLATDPVVVVEAVGQTSAARHAAQILAAGCDLMLLSTGILADDAVRAAVVAAAASGGRVLVPAGAMAGFDGLLALRGQGLTSATYTSVKPPQAWLGSPAEAAHDLPALTEAAVVFEGSARLAARHYPKNANLAASIALAGIGLDETRVRLVADPSVRGNLGRLEAEGPRGRLLVEVGGEAATLNPKSSAIVGRSVLSALANRLAAVSFV